MKGILRCAVAAMALGGFATPAFAGSTEALLQRLHEKGILSDEEYAELMAEQRVEQQSTAAAPMDRAGEALDSNRLVRMTDSGIGFEVGPATIKFSGSVNGFYVHDNPDTASATTNVVGGIASVGGNNTSAVRNGLLPGFLKVDVTSVQEGLNVGAHFGMYPGINSTAWGALGANNGGQPTALATAGIDFRQTYLTVGGKFGEVKIGRDIGLFGSEGILNDITLLSSGTPGNNVAPGNTTLGRIGVGYIYTDFQPQITYTSPSFGGAQVSAAVFQPLSSRTGPAQSNSAPGFQAKLTYDGKFGEGLSARMWLSGITQKHDSLTARDYTGKGVDAGAKVTAGPVTVTGYWYTAKGLGTTVLNLFDTDSLGNPRKSNGYYAQALATFGKISVGASYGVSRLKFANAADALANPDLLDENSSWVGQVRYGLTSWVTLIGEYVSSKAKAHSGNEANSDAVAVGGILFF
ncbi:MAG: porin [Novosphingobium sp.]|nr:porin [Novosphingobium sp.]